MVINAIFYVLCTGCPWAWLPHDYPPKGTVYYYFQKWTKDGTWVKIHEQLRALVRITGSSPSCVEKCIMYYTEAGGAVCG
jgi:putative transposase